MRTDLTVPQQACQAIHAAHEAARHFYFDRIPTLVFLQVPGEAALLEAARLMKHKRIKHIIFREPDFGDIPTAIATGVALGKDRKWFSSYPLWRGSSEKERSFLREGEVAGSSPAPAAMPQLPAKGGLSS